MVGRAGVGGVGVESNGGGVGVAIFFEVGASRIVGFGLEDELTEADWSEAAVGISVESVVGVAREFVASDEIFVEDIFVIIG